MARKKDRKQGEYGPVAKGWKRMISYKEMRKLGTKTGAKTGAKQEVKSVQFNVTLKDDKQLDKLKIKLTLVELHLMQDARDLAMGVVDQKHVLMSRFLERSSSIGEIIGDLTNVWEKKFKLPGLEEAEAAKRIE